MSWFRTLKNSYRFVRKEDPWGSPLLKITHKIIAPSGHTYYCCRPMVFQYRFFFLRPILGLGDRLILNCVDIFSGPFFHDFFGKRELVKSIDACERGRMPDRECIDIADAIKFTDSEFYH